ncbi:sigma 54-interacting transcriptional regulator [Massilia sp. W12]|uniref:sigma 54-interacting transcriptional regulator n=1 Tax=Massilia sp. W12 TaxID=3126507 RepID=UPI0030D2D127
MKLQTWIHSGAEIAASAKQALQQLLQQAGVEVLPQRADLRFGVCLFQHIDDNLLEDLRLLSQQASVLALCLQQDSLSPAQMWTVLQTGAADVWCWSGMPRDAAPIRARMQRWCAVQQLAESDTVQSQLVGQSCAWRQLLHSLVEVAAFTQAPVLVTGETGTGKELVARLIHQLDPRPDKGELVILDCSTISRELSGSEFFGHERGAYTGAQGARDGAFALADGGVLFLDEIGELPLPLQAQLLRVIQEHKYKRLGSNHWQHTEFRLVCATNRDLEAEVAKGNFRADLFYRIAAWRCRTPSLRERKEDILPLAHHFLSQLDRRASNFEFDPAVRQFLQSRDYPGNVRELRQLVSRIWYRHTGGSPITIGDVPIEERAQYQAPDNMWPHAGFMQAVRQAVDMGIGLKEISQAAADVAMQVGLEQEGGNLQRAAKRLGVTDRALQMRKANRRQVC